MGFKDKMCYDVAQKIIEDIFLINYIPTIVEGKSWYDNLNNFLVKEWQRLKDKDEEKSKFTEDEEHSIISDAMQILCDKIGVDDDEWEDHEEDISWDRFDEIIGHYICQYKPKMYGVDGKEININQYSPPAAGGG
jgi:hypothetical protein